VRLFRITAPDLPVKQYHYDHNSINTYTAIYHLHCWVDKVTNVEVRQKVEENRSILNTVQQQKLKMDWTHFQELHDTIEGRMLGKVTRGRKRLQMLSDVSWRQQGVAEG